MSIEIVKPRYGHSKPKRVSLGKPLLHPFSSLLASNIRMIRDNPDMTKKEDRSHYTNEAFQPQVWDYRTHYDTDEPGKGSS